MITSDPTHSPLNGKFHSFFFFETSPNLLGGGNMDNEEYDRMEDVTIIESVDTNSSKKESLQIAGYFSMIRAL